MNFDSILNNNDKLLMGIYEYGFEELSHIQEKVLPDLINNKDLLIQSASGTGKSSVFCIGAIAKLDLNMKIPQIIIISNTKELAQQIQYVIMTIGKYLPIKSSLCIGGDSSNTMINIIPTDLMKQPYIKTNICNSVFLNLTEAISSHILIGTPGRLYDLMTRNKLIYEKLKIIILDEADILLEDNFFDIIYKIISKLPQNIQTCLFSATYPKNIDEIIGEGLLNKPSKHLIKNDELSVKLIKNYYVDVNTNNKLDILFDLYKNLSICQSIIFVNTIDTIYKIVDYIKEINISMSYVCIHSHMSDIERCKALLEFRNGEVRMIIATDIIARGIDIQKVGVIINYEIPMKPDIYMHRIGRSGRYGKRGVAINFIDKYDYTKFDNILTTYKIECNKLANLQNIMYYLSG